MRCGESLSTPTTRLVCRGQQLGAPERPVQGRPPAHKAVHNEQVEEKRHPRLIKGGPTKVASRYFKSLELLVDLQERYYLLDTLSLLSWPQ